MISTKNMILAAMFTALIAVGAFIKIPTPFLPLTLQVLFVIMAGVFLGSKLGALSAFVYLMLGLIGIPIFTNGGGLGYIFQPTFGYIIAFILGAYVTGFICEKSKYGSFAKILIGSLVGLAVIYGIGIIYYCMITQYVNNVELNVSKIFMNLFLLPLPNDIFSCVVASYLGVKLKTILKLNLAL